MNYSTILDEKRRKQFEMVNRLRTRLIEIDTSGDLEREILREFVVVGLDDGVGVNRSLGRLRLDGRMSGGGSW